MKSFAWALIGPGPIAGRFAEAVQRMDGCHLAWVHGRDLSRSTDFASRWSVVDKPPVQAAAQLDELLANPAVDAVYIATPHAFHADAIRRCLLAGKAVLCEKPLVPNLPVARALVELAQARQVFLMEALWTHFLPIYAEVGEWLAQGRIGALRGMQSSFCFSRPFDAASRLFDPAQAGGALLDIGIYNLSVTSWVLSRALGACPPLQGLQAQALLAPSGVDQRLSATLSFGGGLSSQFICGFDLRSDNGFHIFGERGRISLPSDFWQTTEAVLSVDGQPEQRLQRPFQINGFEGEIAAAMRCIEAGAIECPQMPHAQTLATLGWMDQIRAQIGLRYPFES